MNGRGHEALLVGVLRALAHPEERVRAACPLHQPALRQHDVELVDASRFSASATSMRSASPRVPTRRERLQQMVGRRSPRRRRANSRLCAARSVGVEAPPGGVDLQERVLDEVPVRHSGVSIGQYLRRRHAHRPGVPVLLDVPGGRDRATSRHSSAELRRTGHDVRVLAPVDPPDRLSAPLAPRGAAAGSRELPEWLVPLGRHDRVPGQRRGLEPGDDAGRGLALRTELTAAATTSSTSTSRVAPIVCWDALMAADVAARRHVPLLLGQPAVEQRRQRRRRLAAAEPPARADRRLRGRRLDRAALLRRPLPHHPQRRHVRRRVARGAAATAPGEPLQLAFVGQAVERKGLPVLLRAFEALREHVPVELDDRRRDARRGRRRCCSTTRGVHALGKVSDERKRQALREADVLCAPSLGGESFGMVLTEAFAAGTPVVASDIAGYRDVVRDGVDGVLVPRGDATALAETLRDLALDPERRERAGPPPPRMPRQRYAWPRVAARGPRAPTRTRSRCPRPRAARARRGTGCKPADGPPLRAPAPPAEPRARRRPSARRIRRCAIARRAALGAAALGGARPGLRRARSASASTASSDSLLASQPDVGARRRSALMCVLDGPARRSRGTRSCSAALPRRARPRSATRCRARSSAC